MSALWGNEMKTFLISVVPDFPYNSAQVAGREFTRAPQQLAEHELNDEIRYSPLLVIVENSAPEFAPTEKPAEDPPADTPTEKPARPRTNKNA